MCDYSLGGLPNRLATEGEELMVHRFPTDSMGLASVNDMQASGVSPCARSGLWSRIKTWFAEPCECLRIPAVCIPPGACLILMRIPPDMQRKWKLAEKESVIFVQTSAEVNEYRDAVHFHNGRETLLQSLPEGLRVKVVSLGGDPVDEEEPATSIPSGRFSSGRF